MAEVSPAPVKRAATFASARSLEPSPATNIRNRQQNGSLEPKPRLDRRASILSFSSIDEVASTLTDDLINPSMSKPRPERGQDEVTHWHSTPLVFAILPALGGLLFKNGSTFITDILLLTLAAIFMNWSIRLPWDWYYSAQTQRRIVEPDDELIQDDETAVESSSSAGNSPKQSAQQDTSGPETRPSDLEKREAAALELRRQEVTALIATFVCPVFAAYLLHVIRAQLSRPSTSLVSDYNLSIFLLAAEIRPFRQFLRLITNRTLHLQRTVTGLSDHFATSASEETTTIVALTSRVADLEAKLSDHTLLPPNISVAQKTDVSELSAELRKRYDTRIESLERAVRRYEKRSTTLAMLTDQRLGSLESRLNDAVSLAAAATQPRPGVVAKGLEGLSAVIAIPIKVVWGLLMWPAKVLEEAYVKLMGILVGPSAVRSGQRRKSTRHDSGVGGGSREERVPPKEKMVATKKGVR